MHPVPVLSYTYIVFILSYPIVRKTVYNTGIKECLFPIDQETPAKGFISEKNTLPMRTITALTAFAKL